MNIALRTTAAAALALSLLTPVPAHALKITELLASNAAINTDEDGEYSDWLELHNETAAPVNVAGYYLTDDDLAPTKWQLPSTTIAPGGYLLVWASDKNRTTPGSPLHTNFKLSAGGEFLGIIAPDGTTVVHAYSPAFPEQPQDRSWGLAADLATQRCFVIPTPGTANNESVSCTEVEDLQFSPPRGFYDAPFDVTISTPTPGATIRYTLDGTDPSETNGVVYAAPISVDTTTMLRARAFGDDLAPSPSITHTYIFLDHVLQQKTSDQPPAYLYQGADYDMDPDVVNDPRYASTIKDDLKSIPTLSLVMDVDSWFGPQNGILTHRLGEGVAWERPVSAELIRTDGVPGFQINCGVRIQGGTSRLSDLGKYSLRLLFKSIYGPSKLDYAWFPDTPVDEYDTVRLSAFHNNSWAAGYQRSEFIRDTWLKDTQLDMGQLSGHSTYVHLYINGRYWGLFRPTERPNAQFMASHLGGDEEDYDVMNDEGVVDGNRESWDQMHDWARHNLASIDVYEELQKYIDDENLADYMMANIYAGNYDWPDHNWYAGRLRQPGAGYMFFSWDAELILGEISGNRINVAAFDTPGALWSNMRKKSAEFRQIFGDRVHKHFFHDGALTPQKNIERFMKRATEIDRAVVGESARWGDRARQVPYTRDIEWIIELRRLVLAYFPARSRIVLQQFRDNDLYPNVVAPNMVPYGGEFFPGEEITLSAPAGIIYFTLDGNDPREPGGGISPSAIDYSGPIDYLTEGTTIKSRALVGIEWSALEEATFIPATPLRITELMYNPTQGLGAEFLEMRNIGVSPLVLTGMQLTAGVTFTFPSLILQPGAHALVVENAATFQNVYGAGHPVAGVYSGRLDNGGERIRLQDASGAEIHDFEFDDAWHPLSDGPGRSLVIRDASAELGAWGQASGWRASAASGGTAGAAEPALCANGIDDDGDGLSDLADDGCGDAAQDEENPACNDGIDNDGDAATDDSDIHCTDPSLDSEAPPPGDSFLCYRTRRRADSSTLTPLTVTVEDEFDGEVDYTVTRPQTICMAGALNGAPAYDDQTHLRSYEIRAVAGEPLHVPRIGLFYEGGLAPVFVDTTKAEGLLVPAHVDPSSPPAEPVAMNHGVDFYKCYRTTVPSSSPRYFPTKAQSAFADEFEDRSYLLRPPTRVCTPASLDGSAVKTPGRHLLCYRASRDKFFPKHAPVAGVHTADVFLEDRIDTVLEQELCVPSTLVE
ncbi:MAG TPA: lamin tail domain-containing protein [Candidatus Binatia bacterium]|nr:lamin tail domain-containing protein [Candidatus Binatia bacterium]